MLLISDLIKDLPGNDVISQVSGKVLAIQGQTIHARLPHASLGDICRIEIRKNNSILAQVVSFNENEIILAPFSDIRGISPGVKVYNESANYSIQIPDTNGGLVIDALGNVLKQEGNPNSKNKIKLNLFNSAPNPLTRINVEEQLETGIKSIDTLCSIGYGQRLGLFASAGLGKSTLLGMLARGADVDITVIALTGERGREVREFIECGLGEDGLSKSILVVATSDKPALQRSLAAVTATSIAEHYRSQGKRVLLLIDSLTRMARAIRDVSLAAGELPIRQGLTSSVYTELPRLIERAGNDNKGSITAIYTLLDSSEFEPDPLAEEVKSLLDGHICLDSSVATQNIRPAVDFTRSISRCVNSILSNENLNIRDRIISILSKLKKEKDMIMLGGTPDKELQACLLIESELKNFLKQAITTKFGLNESFSQLKEIYNKYIVHSEN